MDPIATQEQVSEPHDALQDPASYPGGIVPGFHITKLEIEE